MSLKRERKETNRGGAVRSVEVHCALRPPVLYARLSHSVTSFPGAMMEMITMASAKITN